MTEVRNQVHHGGTEDTEEDISLVQNNILTAEPQRTQRMVIFDLRGDDRKSKGLIPSRNKHVAPIGIPEMSSL